MDMNPEDRFEAQLYNLIYEAYGKGLSREEIKNLIQHVMSEEGLA